jgi:chorismate lyase/3-hydroxybenzoate synthase
MRTKSPNLIPAPAIDPADGGSLAAPRWANDLVGQNLRRSVRADEGLTLDLAQSSDFALLTARIRGIDALPPADVERSTAEAYAAIAGQIGHLAASHPVRFWNYIPAIHRPSGQSPEGEPIDRYMAFNAGRYIACSRWLGGEDAFPRLLATASGVGHDGEDLVIHALSASRPGVAVENPRQVPAYRYSRRYGPRPPCFARATVVTKPDQESLILVGGTASVRGEASVHIGDLEAQLDETLENLTALLRAATASPSAGVELFTDVRVYYVRASDLAATREMCRRAFVDARLEFVRADLCRQDLLLEIEGVANTV